MDSDGPNKEQIEYWNTETGEKWVELYPLIDSLIRPLGLLAMQRLGDLSGRRVLDIGCGCGDATLELARRAGPSGSVTGLDVSAPMLGAAQRRAAAEGLGNATFERADAQVHAFAAASYDALFSRFGVMFFTDPRLAFTNLRGALRPGGRLAFACWRTITENEWMMVPLRAALEHVPPPPPPAADAPGPFAFADRERVEGILGGAGFADVAIERVDEALTYGSDLDTAANFVVQMGPAGRVLRDADPGVLPAVIASVRKALEPYRSDEGIRIQSSAWMVSARNPA